MKSSCEPRTVDQISSMMQFDADPIKFEPDDVAAVSNGCEQMGAGSSRMEDQIDKCIPNGLCSKRNSPFEYEICGRLFNKKYDMTNHLITHSKARPFECWLCHKM